MTRWFADHVGLAQPYRFERTLAILFALLLAVLAGAALVHYRLAGELTRGTPRFGYFLYLAALLGLAVLGARWPRFAIVALSLAALELGLGVGANVLQRYGYAHDDLLPENEAAQAPRNWHSLLQTVIEPGTVRRLWDGEIRYNSLGQRGPERSPESLRGKTIVALFGGSTTEDVAVPDGQAWSERLEHILGASRFAVINHGSAWYTSVLTAFYEQAFGVMPDCAVYHLGGVELQNAHFRGLDPGYADYHTPSLVDAFAARRTDKIAPSISPTLRYLDRLMVLAFDTLRPAQLPRGEASGAADPNLEAIYARNIRTISAINRQRGIKTVWIGEFVVPDALNESDPDADPWAPYVPAEAGWRLLSRLKEVLKREAMALGDVYIDIPVKEFTGSDFVDQEHYSAEGSLKFATLVAPKIGETCRKGG